MLDTLRTIARAVSPIALDIYDKEDPQSILDMIAVSDTAPRGATSFEREWWSVFPELRRWVGDRESQKAFKANLEGSIGPYEITFDYDRDLIETPEALARAESLAGATGRAFASGKVWEAYKLLRGNPVAYDGQDFFDTDHVHPNGAAAPANLLTVGTAPLAARSTPAAPTKEELYAELKVARTRLLELTLVRNRLLRTNKVRDNLVVIARSFATWSGWDALLNDATILSGTTAIPNPAKGSFELLRDFDPLSGTEDSYDVIHSVPGGPRPLIWVTSKEPSGFEFDTSQGFRSRYIACGMDGRYGSAVAFWQTALRVDIP